MTRNAPAGGGRARGGEDFGEGVPGGATGAAT